MVGLLAARHAIYLTLHESIQKNADNAFMISFLDIVLLPLQMSCILRARRVYAHLL